MLAHGIYILAVTNVFQHSALDSHSLREFAIRESMVDGVMQMMG
jgi:hypothetical protein